MSHAATGSERLVAGGSSIDGALGQRIRVLPGRRVSGEGGKAREPWAMTGWDLEIARATE